METDLKPDRYNHKPSRMLGLIGMSFVMCAIAVFAFGVCFFITICAKLFLDAL